MTKTLRQRWLISEGDSETAYLDMTASLASGETIATVAVTEETTSDLGTITAAVTAAAYTDPHRRDTSGDLVTVGIAKAVTMAISGQLAAHSPYALLVTMTTSASRTLKRRLVFDVA